MKYPKYFNALLMTGLAVIIFSLSSFAQSSFADKSDPKKIAFKNMVDSQHFVFVAQSVSPLRGRFRNLTSSYDVNISKDTMICYLPYFGRAYSAPIDPSSGGLDFTSTNFSYSVTPHKKDGWNVMIKPKDNTNVQQLLFTIFDNGSASLNVTSTSRDPISFNGHIEKEQKKKKKKK
ncbi:MAG: DUF4251 domain-containing protein [Ginsengibacter sp.]